MKNSPKAGVIDILDTFTRFATRRTSVDVIPMVRKLQSALSKGDASEMKALLVQAKAKLADYNNALAKQDSRQAKAESKKRLSEAKARIKSRNSGDIPSAITGSGWGGIQQELDDTVLVHNARAMKMKKMGFKLK